MVSGFFFFSSSSLCVALEADLICLLKPYNFLKYDNFETTRDMF